MRVGIAVVGAILVLGGCESPPEQTAAPEGLSASIMQYRGKRLTRDIAVAFTNDARHAVELESMRLTSNRLSEPFTWDGAERVDAGYGTGIDVTPSQGTCPDGEDLATTAEVTYRYDGQERRSRLAVTDPYDVLGSLVDGDCGQQSFAEAATVDVGTPMVEGDTWSADVMLTPTGDRDDVVLLGFAPTLKFAFGPRTPTDVEVPLDQPQRLHLDVVMGRCDPHIVAEDKVGSRFGARVRTADVEEAYFTLDLPDAVHASLDEFYAARCRL